MLSILEEKVLALATEIPLTAFAFVASFIEEVVAPIPSPMVMLVTGSFARVQNLHFGEIAFVILIATCGKTLGALCVYGIAAKAEGVVLGRFSRFFGLTQADVTNFGKKLQGTMRDYVLLTVLRALPIVPSVLLSAGGGLLKLHLRLFITTTFLGTILRDSLYLYVGYVGTQALERLLHTSSRIEDYVLYATVGVFGVLLLIHMRRKSSVFTRGS
jgi:membrane protein DedA with SNARE-associated domain